MTSSRPTPGTITAAASLGIFGSLAMLAFWGWMISNTFENASSASRNALFAKHPLLSIALLLVPPLFALQGLATSIGLFRLRSWARSSALLWAVLCLCICAYLIALRPYETFVIEDRFLSDDESFKQLLAFALVAFLLPISVGWLALFTRTSIKSLFSSSGSTF